MRVRGIKSGFDFITQPAGFGIGESVVPFDSSESYGKAFLVGLSNTFRVAILGIIMATLLGTLVGIGRLSRNLLVRSLSGAYVDFFRNVPLLLQLFIWYFVLTELLPPIEEALHPLPGLFFSKNGLQFPHPDVGARSLGHGDRIRCRVLRHLGLVALRRGAPRGHRPGPDVRIARAGHPDRCLGDRLVPRRCAVHARPAGEDRDQRDWRRLR